MSELNPPVAARKPIERTHHGDVFVDDYEWLRDKSSDEVLDYLRAENDYTEKRTAHLESLREAIFSEISDRTLQTDLSVPARRGGFWYYTRTVEGKQYAISAGSRWTATSRPRPTARSRRRGDARRERGGRGLGVLRARHRRCLPRQPAARLLGRPDRRRAVHPAGQGPGHRRTAARRGPGVHYGSAWSGRRLDDLLHEGRRGLAAVPGLAARPRQPHRRRRAGAWRRPTSGSGSAST